MQVTLFKEVSFSVNVAPHALFPHYKLPVIAKEVHKVNLKLISSNGALPHKVNTQQTQLADNALLKIKTVVK